MKDIMWFALIFVTVFCLTHSSSAENNLPLVLEGGVVIDGTGSSPIREAIVVMKNGRISEIGSKTEVRIPDNSKVIDIKGGTILPGFINAHVHRSYNIEKLYAWAESGVTTVRDLAAYPPKSSYQLRDSLNKDPRAARLVHYRNPGPLGQVRVQ